MYVLQCYIVYYALLCFNDLTGDVCIGMLTERLWMVHIRQHADVFLQMEIASAVRAAFYIDCRMLSCTHWFCICRSLANRYNLFKKIARLAETYHSKPAMFSTNQRQHCLARVLPPLGLIACFSALGSGWNKGYCFCSSFSYPH